MSEFWVSKKKYFCKYCDIYIADDAPSRQHHENGMKHKGNLERFIRGLYKGSEKRKKELEEEKRDMARVEQAARAAFAQDVASGHARATTEASTSKASTAASKPAPKPSNPYANYSTAESLGYTDPDAERIAAELERRRTQGVVGDWEVVSTGPSTSSIPPPVEDDNGMNEDGEEAKPSIATLDAEDTQGGVEREAEAPPEEDERTFKLRRRTLGVGLGEIYDPGAIKIKVKKKEEPTPIPPPPPASTSDLSQPSATTAPKWTPLHLKKPGDPASDSVDSSASQAAVKSESNTDTLPTESTPNEPSSSKWSKSQWSAATPDSGVKEEETPLVDSGVKHESNASPPIKEEADSVAPKLEEPASAAGGGVFRKRKIAGRGGKRSS